MGYTSILQAINEPPAPTAGVPTGQGDWRFAVQILTSSGGARVGSAVVGTARVSEYVWTDLTPDVTEVEWSRGSNSFDRGLPRADVGVAQFTLSNPTQYYSSWNRANSLYREWTTGAVVRFVSHRPSASSSWSVANGVTSYTRTDWTPLYTGVAEAWDENIQIVTSSITVTLAETFSILAGIDNNERGPIGTGDTVAGRFTRLLDDAAWKFGLTITDTATGAGAQHPTSTAYNDVTYQPTTMAANRLSEIYLTADSAILCPVISGRDGSCRWGLPAWAPTSPYVWFTSANGLLTGLAAANPQAIVTTYTPPLTLTNNSDFVINDVSVARAGSTAWTFTNVESKGKFGLRDYNRTDLICDDDADTYYAGLWQISTYAGIGGTQEYLKSDQTIQPGTVRIVDCHDAQRLLDIYDYVALDWTNFSQDVSTKIALQFNGRLIGANQKIGITKTGITWVSEYSIFANSNRERTV